MRPAQWLHPSVTIRIGSGASTTSSMAAVEPEAPDANSNAAVVPAPSPDENDMHHPKLSRCLSG